MEPSAPRAAACVRVSMSTPSLLPLPHFPQSHWHKLPHFRCSNRHCQQRSQFVSESPGWLEGPASARPLLGSCPGCAQPAELCSSLILPDLYFSNIPSHRWFSLVCYSYPNTLYLTGNWPLDVMTNPRHSLETLFSTLLNNSWGSGAV